MTLVATPSAQIESNRPPAPRRKRLHIPTRLRWALILVVVYHGSLLLFGSYQGTYDAYVHIFLGDHYARDWFSTWDQRWYTGFTTVSYPPGTHMTIGALSKVLGGLELAFAIAQIAALLNLTVGMYRFARVWVDDEAAANASLLLVLSSAIAETVHLFGQLPTTFALGFLLQSIPFIRRWTMEGRFVDLFSGIIVLAACTAGHHVTTLFGSVFFLGPVLVAGILERSRVPRADEVNPGDPKLTPRLVIPMISRRIRRVAGPLIRAGILGPCILVALVGVVLPYWLWSATDPIVQISIPHGSRANFLEDRNIGLVFFAIPWGLLFFVIPYALVRATLDKKWPLAASILLLFVLGTGGTTPIPRMILGHAFDILTLDRFTFWASIQILPLAGVFVTSLEKGSIAAWIRNTGGKKLLIGVQTVLVVGMVAMSLFAATLSQFRPFQPDRIDVDPIVAFMEKDQHERWRFLTLGFGDQMAWLSAQMEATQVDGNYHSVRRLPELTSTSVERLEGAKYRGISGLGSLQQFLGVPEKYNLKFVFSNDQFYDPLLHFNGWVRLGPLPNGIMVWERADIEPLPAQLPVRERSRLMRLMWGVIPPSTIVGALLVLLWTATGRPGMRRRELDMVKIDERLIIGPFRRLDGFLRRQAEKLPSDAPERTGDAWTQRLLGRVQDRLRHKPSRRRRVARLLVLALLVGIIPVRAIMAANPEPDPAEIVADYFDDLDFRRWNDAYAKLDPVTRPDFELWRLQLSVNGGVLASYAKLDSLETYLLEKGDGRAVVFASLRYITALDWYPIERDIQMIERGGEWFIVPDPSDPTVPPDQLVRRAEVDYLIQGRRRVTSATTDLADVQDRPELFIRSGRLVEMDGQPVVVGEVMNLDVDPADLTITAVLRNEDGDIMARYNATEEIIHSILPRESTPFLIRFEEVAAGTDLDFDPLDFTPIQLTDEIVEVEIYAKAVVTSFNLYRGLGVNDARLITRTDGSMVLEGELRNDGTQEATIPQVVLSYLDEAGDVLWVETHYLDTAIRSQRLGQFALELPDMDSISLTDIPVRRFANGILPTEDPQRPKPVLIELPEDAPFASVRVDLATFVGSVG